MLPAGDEDKLLLIPGPTPVAREILTALARPTISHTSKQMAKILTEALDRLRVLTDNTQGEVFVFSGSGTLAQEAAIINFVEPTDRLLVASNGFFGDRMTEIALAHELAVSTTKAPWGTSITPDQLRDEIEKSDASIVALTHVETSTGVMAPLAELIAVIRERGAISIVDGVAAMGGIPEPMDNLGIDVLLSGPQKALGVPPGLSIVCVSEQAWRKRTDRAQPLHAYYADLSRWQPIMREPDRYFSTHAVNLIYALASAMQIIAREGLDARYERHRELGTKFRSAFLDMGFELFTDSAFLAPTLSVLKTPPEQASTELRRRLSERSVIAAAGIGDAEDRIVRFGHMGNITEAEIAVAVDAANSSLAEI